MTCRKEKQRGFTLLEVVIAVAILGVSLTMLLATQASSLNNAARARDLTVATLLARSKMIDIERELFDEGFTTGDQEDDGDFDEEGHAEIKWTSKIQEIELDLSGLTGLMSSFGEESDDDDSGGMDYESMLSSFGGPFEGMMNDIGNSLRIVEVTVTWPVGDKFTESMVIRALITREDLALVNTPVFGQPPPQVP